MKKAFTLVLLSFLFNQLLCAQQMTSADNPSEVMNAFSKMNVDMKTFQARFTQTRELSFMDKSLISTGSFSYSKPDKLRWEYQQPIQYTMLINSNSIRISEGGVEKSYSPAANQIFKTVKEVILGCINGTILNSADYSTSYYENTDAYKLILVPRKKGMKDFMQEISIIIDRKSLTPHSLILKDGAGDLSTILFEDKKVNHAIAQKTFDEL